MIDWRGLRYRSVSGTELSPILRLESGFFPVFGRRLYQVNAWLRDGLGPVRAGASLYSSADGTGAHGRPLVARHMAISEAMERWAYHATVGSERGAEYGFDRDPSSNGLAAFPGWTTRPARRLARWEAIERFYLLAWWEGLIEGTVRDSGWPEVSALELGCAWGGVAVLLHRRAEAGFYCYGHAAAESFEAACAKALIELARHEWVLRCRCLLHGQLAGEPALTHPLERRSLFFATEAGHALFQERLARRGSGPGLEPEVLVDRELRGPWSKYTTVWRCALRPPSGRYLAEGDDYFFW